MAGPAAFVGREGELSRLLGALDGDAGLLLVVGDAGVGKTRFTAEGMTRAAAAGRVMVRGDCLPLAGSLPLLPVTQALRELGALEGGQLLEQALAAAPAYAREEIGRLLPRLGPGDGPGPGDRGEAWRRERQFSAVAELLEAVARTSGAGVGLVVEDVHWADSATLDCLTFLAQTVRGGAVTLVVTCRGDEAPLAAPVADWLAYARGGAGVEEIRLGPLPRAAVAAQVAALAGAAAAEPVVDELFARAEGNPFFTEQLVAAALAAGPGDGLRVPVGLPGRLAELLAARAGRCTGEARVVLAALAVAARPLAEDQVCAVSGLDAAAVRRGLRELAAARLLAEDTGDGGGHRPRHALLAEAVATGLLPGERAALHEATARALQAAGDETLAAEAAGHWQAAGRPADELPARIAAAAAAEGVFGYAQAAAHWQRAIDLAQALPHGAADIPDAELPQLYLRAMDAAEKAGDIEQAGRLAEEAYRRFAAHPDPATAAVIHHRAGEFRLRHSPETARPLIEESLRLFELAPPSAEYAQALSTYGWFLVRIDQRWQANHASQVRAAEIAEAAGANAKLAVILSLDIGYLFYTGCGEEAFATLRRARRAAEASGDGIARLTLDTNETAAMQVAGDFARAEEVAVSGLHAAHQVGLAHPAATLANNAAYAIWSQGRTAEAAALIEPMTSGPPRKDNWMLHVNRAFLDMLRGDLEAATGRLRQVEALPGHFRDNDEIREAAELTVEVALWAGRPGDALAQARQALAPYENMAALNLDSGRLLALGLRACADLAEQARARQDHDAAQAAQAAARELAGVADGMEQAPFTDHPFVATVPAARASWQAEWTRLDGASDPAAWAVAAKTWQGLGCPHRAGYALWRQAQAQLDAGQPVTAAAAALRAAAAAADGHAPLSAQIRALAERARIPLQAPPTDPGDAAPAAEAAAPYGLTGRELTVLRLLAAGRTNAQIGAELYISATTARVHVSNILRKLDVTSRVQAAALAERAGLLDPGQP